MLCLGFYDWDVDRGIVGVLDEVSLEGLYPGAEYSK